VDFSSPLHGGHLAAHVLAQHGVDALFTLAGGHVSPVFVAAEQMRVRVVDVRDEATAVFAADGYARLTGRVGVAVVTAGPGLTNTVTAVKNAQMAESPVLIISGAAATILKGRGALQDIDQIALMKPICKSTHTVARVRDIPTTLLRAIQHALTEPKGPVYVELPIDTLYPIDVVARSVDGGNSEKKKKPSTAAAAVIDYALSLYVRYVFGDAFKGFAFDPAAAARGDSPLRPLRPVAPLPVPRPLLAPSKISAAAAALVAARRPVLLLGSQTVSRGRLAAEELAAKVSELGIPTFLAGMARGLLGADGSGCQLRHVRRKALASADVIILAGITPDFRLDYGRTLSRRAKILACNANPSSLHLNQGIFWTPTVAALGDPAEFVGRIADAAVAAKAAGKFRVDTEWVEGLRAEEAKKEDANRAKALTPCSDTSLQNPLATLYALERLLPPSTILVADGGDYVGTAAYILRPRRPLAWLDPGAFGTLGVGAGFAIAAKVVCPEACVVVVYGDGSFGWSLSEVDTWVRQNLPIVAIIGNDAKWS
ncbi:hypothetical protein HK405_013077, partial [Cladochytrium tenue]